MGYLLAKWEFSIQLCEITTKKQSHMKTLTISYDSHLGNISQKYHKSQAEALAWWKNYNKKYTNERMLLMKNLKRTGHKYEIACRTLDSWGEEYFKYIHCYLKYSSPTLS